MGDVGDTFRAFKEAGKVKKQRNLEYSTSELIRLGVRFTSKNSGIHLIVYSKESTFDFYPSTGKFARRGGKWKRGLKNLLRDIGVADEVLKTRS